MSASYRLHYETRGGRCVWCWEALGELESHTVVSAVAPPSLELRFHHQCWPSYLAVAALDGRDGRHTGRAREWPPERVEKLRIHCGLTATAFRRELHWSQDRLARVLTAQEQPSESMANTLREVANRYRFEAVSDLDWSRPAVVHSLVQKLAWTRGQLARAVGARETTVQRWVAEGVPARSLRAQNRFGQLALRHGFTAADVIDDYLWTAADVASALEVFGLETYAFAQAIGMSATSVREWIAGRVPVSRAGAWRLTREAIRRGLPLPARQ
jgi:hypothetical protein